VEPESPTRDRDRAFAAAEYPPGPYFFVFSGDSVRRIPVSVPGTITLLRTAEGAARFEDDWPESSAVGIRISETEAVLEIREPSPQVRVNSELVSGAKAIISGDTVSVGSLTVVFHRPTSRIGSRLLLDGAALLNRLRQEIERSLRYGRPLSVLAVDTGDDLALGAAVRDAILGIVRFVDIVGWDGGREVVVVFPETSADAVVPAERVLGAAARLVPSVRAGLAGCPTDGADAETLLAGARLAAASTGSNTVAAIRDAVTVHEIGGSRILVADPKMRRLFELIRDLAASEIPVLVTGETGTGKEIVAQALHAWSPRGSRPLVSVNCAAVTESLLESELFGHERGAFTGATSARTGLLESARGGTVFLDEITESTPRAQAELLRALETRRIRPVGSVSERPIDVRIVAATNRNIEEEIEAGRFRKDLYYRLGAAMLSVPPLRERPLEIPLIARTFLADACRRADQPPLEISSRAMQRLELHDWPGNVREMKNLMEFMAASVRGESLDAEMLPERIGQRAAPWLVGRAVARPELGAGGTTGTGRIFRKLEDEIQELERTRIEEALVASNGARAQAAKLIGMPLRTLVSKIRLYDLGSIPSGRGRKRCDP
jgi:two-component system response regulator AtoC